jgi:hypothetical protein
VLAAQLTVARELIVILGAGAELAGQPAEVGDVPVPGGLGLLADQPLGPELADRVEQPVPRVVLLRTQHDRLVHQADKAEQDVLAGQRPAGADRLGGGNAERAGEHRQPCPQQPFGGRAELVAPLRGGAQCLLVRRHRPVAAGEQAAGEQAEAVLQAAAQLLEGERAQLHGGQLDGQRDTVQAPAQLDYLVPVGGGDGEARHGRRGPLAEQFHRVPAPSPAGTTPVGITPAGFRLGDRQRRYRAAVLARHVHRLPAGGQHGYLGRVAQYQADQRGAGADQVLAGVEDEQQLTVAQVVHDRVRLGPGILLGQPEPARDGVR